MVPVFVKWNYAISYNLCLHFWKMWFKIFSYFSSVKLLGLTYSAGYFLTVCEGCIHFDQCFLIFITISVASKQKINFPWNTSSFYSSFCAWLWKCFFGSSDVRMQLLRVEMFATLSCGFSSYLNYNQIRISILRIPWAKIQEKMSFFV